MQHLGLAAHQVSQRRDSFAIGKRHILEIERQTVAVAQQRLAQSRKLRHPGTD